MVYWPGATAAKLLLLPAARAKRLEPSMLWVKANWVVDAGCDATSMTMPLAVGVSGAAAATAPGWSHAAASPHVRASTAQIWRSRHGGNVRV